jgi:hypothetical protein
VTSPNTETIEVPVPPSVKQEWDRMFYELAARGRVKYRADFVAYLLEHARQELVAKPTDGQRSAYPIR